MTEFEPRSSGIGSDRASNSATTTGVKFVFVLKIDGKEDGDCLIFIKKLNLVKSTLVTGGQTKL